jgi:hypothetical protein
MLITSALITSRAHPCMHRKMQGQQDPPNPGSANQDAPLLRSFFLHISQDEAPRGGSPAKLASTLDAVLHAPLGALLADPPVDVLGAPVVVLVDVEGALIGVLVDVLGALVEVLGGGAGGFVGALADVLGASVVVLGDVVGDHVGALVAVLVALVVVLRDVVSDAGLLDASLAILLAASMALEVGTHAVLQALAREYEKLTFAAGVGVARPAVLSSGSEGCDAVLQALLVTPVAVMQALVSCLDSCVSYS